MNSSILSSLKKAREKVNFIKQSLQNNPDIVTKNMVMCDSEICCIYIDGLANVEEINENIMRPITTFSSKNKVFLDSEFLKDRVFSFSGCSIINEEMIEDKILRGFTILFIDNDTGVLCFNTVMYPSRSVQEPPTSTVINGPREGFTELLKTNLSLIRKRLPTKSLKIEEIIVGERTKTRINLVYLSDVAKGCVVEEIKNKLSHYEIDGVIDSYYIIKFLESKPNSIFRQVGSCEKPDIACAKMLEGRVVILVDGSPICLTVPFIVFEDFQSSNDYYSDAHRVSLLRIIRVLGLCISVFLPGMYIALQLYHYKVLPLKFLITIVNTTQNLPLNPFLETFFILVLFDILFEASVRMPKYLGMAISIVGALILGDTAVKAGLVSPPGVMIIALSAITIYIIPNQSSQISLLRIIFAMLGGTLGFHGVILGSIFLISYLCSLESFGSSYLAPYSPFIFSDQKDFILKEGLMKMNSRPQSIPNKNKIRLKRKVVKNEKNNNK